MNLIEESAYLRISECGGREAAGQGSRGGGSFLIGGKVRLVRNKFKRGRRTKRHSNAKGETGGIKKRRGEGT